MAIDWSKYGIEDSKPAKSSVTRVDWTKYDPEVKAAQAKAVRSAVPELFNPFTQQAAIKSTLAPVVPQFTSLPSTEDMIKADFEKYKPEYKLTRQEWIEREKHKRANMSTPGWDGFRKAIEPLNVAMDYVMAYTPGLSDFQRGAGSALGVQAHTAPSSENPFIRTTAGFAGNVAGAVTNPSNIGQGLVTAPLQVGRGVAQTAANKAPVLGNKFAQRGIEGAVAGGIQGGVISGVRGETSAEEMALNIGLGAGLGAAGDVALAGIGSAAKSIINKYRPAAPTPAPPLGLPAPRQRGNVNTAVADDVITPEYAFKLDAPSEKTLNRQTNAKAARNDLKVIDDEIRQLEASYERAVIDEYNYLQQSLKERGGVQQGQLQTNVDGVVTGRTGRMSNNPLWYQEFYASNNKVPSNKELYNLAKQRVDEGFRTEEGNVPSWKARNNFDESMEALQSVKTQINNSLREVDPAINITKSPLVNSEISFTPKAKEIPQNGGVGDSISDSSLGTTPLSSPATKGDWFTNTFGVQGVGVTSGKRSGKELIDTHIVENAKEPASIMVRMGETVEKIEQEYIDKFAPFKKIDKPTYDAAMDSTRANNLANITIKDKFVDLEGNVIGKSLKEVYDNVPRGYKNVADRYIIAKDAIDRMDRNIKVYGEEKWFPQTSEEAAKLVGDLESQYPWLKNLSDDWNQFNRNRQDLWVQSGIASQELIDTLRHTNPNYAPMFRQQPVGSLSNKIGLNTQKAGFSGQKAPIKRAVGSTKKIIEPAQGMIETTASSYHAMMRNRAMQSLYKAVETNPEKYSGVIKIVDDAADIRQDALKKINAALEENGPDGVADMLNAELTDIFRKAKQTGTPNKATVTVMINGEPRKLEVSDASLLKAIEGITPEQLEGIVKIADFTSRAIKQSATGLLAPLQGARLAFRDLPIAAAQSKDKLRFVTDISHAMISQVADWLPNFVPGAKNVGKLARDYYRAGGGYEAYLKGDSKVRAAARDITKDPLLSGRNLAKAAKNYNPFVPLKAVGDAMENIPRIAAYAAEMRKSGWKRTPESVRAALDAGREATVNWSRRGSRGANLEAAFPYSNAAIQGTYRLQKRFKEQPIAATMLIASIAGAKIAAYEKFKDDKDFQQRSKYEKGIPVAKTKDGKFVTIPIEPAEAYIADQILHFYKWAVDQEEAPNIKENLQSGSEAFLPNYLSAPLSAFTSEGKAVDLPGAFLKGAGGSIADPLFAVTLGINYAGRDIVPREYQGDPTNLKYNETTSAAGKWAAENLNIDAFTFDYLAQKLGGDIAKIGLPLTSDVGKGDIEGNLIDQVNARLKLLEDPVMKNNIADDYYKYADIVKEAKTISDRKLTPLPKWYRQAYDEVTSTKKGSINSRVSELNSQKKEVQRDLKLTAEQRADQLRDIQREINLLRIKGIERLQELGVDR